MDPSITHFQTLLTTLRSARRDVLNLIKMRASVHIFYSFFNDSRNPASKKAFAN